LGAFGRTVAEDGRWDLHSSWDDKTAMRHGVPWVAIQEFLKKHLPGKVNDAMVGSGDARQADVLKKRKLPEGDGNMGDAGDGLEGKKLKVSFVDLTGLSAG